MEHLSNTEAKMKKVIAYKKTVQILSPVLVYSRNKHLSNSVLPDLSSGMRIFWPSFIQLIQIWKIENQGEKKFSPVITSMFMFLSRLQYSNDRQNVGTKWKFVHRRCRQISK